MSSTQAPAASKRRARRRLAVCLSLLAASADMGAAAAAPQGKIYFFATRDACVASSAFSPRDCAAAFANARLQLRDRAPRFATAGACRLRFRLCEVSRGEPDDGEAMAYAQGDAVAYAPMALGVEMLASPRGAEAAPTLAIDSTGRLFPYFPVSRPYEARHPDSPENASAPENAGILSADRFEPFSRRKPLEGASTFTASALGAIKDATHDAATTETPEERRARLRAAPFVE